MIALAFSSPKDVYAQNYIYQELHSFSGYDAATNGTSPRGALMQGLDGNFYGTCYYDGQPTSNCPTCGYGTVFRMSPDGALTILTRLGYTNGAYPFGAMIQATDGNFYGSSERGGFRVTTNGVLTGGPGGGDVGDPIQGTNGYIYGADSHYGVVAWASLDDTYYREVSARGTPSGGLIQASDGNFYGLTYNGGAYNLGTAYKLTPSGVLTTLVSFGPISTPPARPYGKLLQASDGSLYGVADYADGVVFRLSLSGTLTNLAWFGVGDAVGQSPNGGLIEANDGNFYGTTFEGGSGAGTIGTVFKMTPQGRISTLFVFSGTGAVPGTGPLAGLVQGSDGNLYGTCAYGGTRGGGNIFRIVMPGPTLNSMRVGQQLIFSWRTNYTGFKLQSSSSFSGQWTDCTNAPSVVGQNFFVTNSASATAQFFRLKK